MHRQAIVAYGAPLEAREDPTPEPAGTQVLVRVSHCGVCHSDVHLQDGYFDLGEGKRLDVTAGRDLPFTLGHEIAGEVVALGPDAEAAAGEAPGDMARLARPGARVAVYPWIGCGACSLCGRGLEHLCNRPRALGITVDGGYATHVLLPHPRYLLDMEGLAPEMAGCFMCSGLTAYSAYRKAEPFLRAGPLVIVGLGGVGMMGLQIARALTDGPVLVADVAGAKREAALGAGATDAFDPADPEARKAILSRTGGGAGAVIDFAGSQSSMQFSQGLVAKGGAVVVVGLMGGRFSLPVPMFPLRALSIIGSYVGSLEEARAVLDLARRGRIAPIPVTLRPLAEADRSLNDLREGNVLGRIVLTP